jgi:hypothetical protein
VNGLILFEIFAGVICWGVIWIKVLLGAAGETTLNAYAPYCSSISSPFTIIFPVSALIEQESIVTSRLQKTFTTTTWNNIKTKVSNIVTGMKNAVVNTVTNMATSFINKVKGIYNGIIKIFSNIKSKMLDVGKNVVSGIWEGISASTQWIKDKITGWVGNVTKFLKSVFGIGSPSRLMEDEIGVWLPPGMAKGFDKALPAAMYDMESKLNYCLGKFDVKEIDIVGLSNSFTSVVTDVADWFTSIEERLAKTVDAVKTDISDIIGAGQSIITPDTIIGNLAIDRPSKSLEVSTPGIGTSGNGGEKTINNFTFYSNESIDEIKAAKLLKETQRDLAEGYL